MIPPPIFFQQIDERKREPTPPLPKKILKKIKNPLPTYLPTYPRVMHSRHGQDPPPFKLQEPPLPTQQAQKCRENVWFWTTKASRAATLHNNNNKNNNNNNNHNCTYIALSWGSNIFPSTCTPWSFDPLQSMWSVCLQFSLLETHKENPPPPICTIHVLLLQAFCHFSVFH